MPQSVAPPPSAAAAEPTASPPPHTTFSVTTTGVSPGGAAHASGRIRASSTASSASSPSGIAAPPSVGLPHLPLDIAAQSPADQMRAYRHAVAALRADVSRKDARIRQLSRAATDAAAEAERDEEHMTNTLQRRHAAVLKKKEELLAHKRAEETRKAQHEDKLQRLKAERAQLASRIKAEEEHLRSRLRTQIAAVQEQRQALEHKLREESATLTELQEAFLRFQLILDHAQHSEANGDMGNLGGISAPRTSSRPRGPRHARHHSLPHQTDSEAESSVAHASVESVASSSVKSSRRETAPHRQSSAAAVGHSDAFMIRQLQVEIRRARALQTDMRSRTAHYLEKQELLEERLFNWMNRHRHAPNPMLQSSVDLASEATTYNTAVSTARETPIRGREATATPSGFPRLHSPGTGPQRPEDPPSDAESSAYHSYLSAHRVASTPSHTVPRTQRRGSAALDRNASPCDPSACAQNESLNAAALHLLYLSQRHRNAHTRLSSVASETSGRQTPGGSSMCVAVDTHLHTPLASARSFVHTLAHAQLPPPPDAASPRSPPTTGQRVPADPLPAADDIALPEAATQRPKAEKHTDPAKP